MTKKKQKQKKKNPKVVLEWRRWLTRFFIAVAIVFFLGVLVVGGLLLYFSAGLPSFETLADYKPPQVTRFFDRNGRLVAEYYDEKRTKVDVEQVPLHVRKAFLAAEDADFYHHKGMDINGLLRALWNNLKAGRVVQGGSTITQQVIKTFIVGSERKYSRKIREILLALRLEANLTKDEILGLYLNQIFLGHHCYGVQEASRYYFDKDISEVTLAEGALLASLPKSPVLYSPIKHPDAALQRRSWVLDQMHDKFELSADDSAKAKKEPLTIASQAPNFYELAPYYAENVRRLLEKEFSREDLRPFLEKEYGPEFFRSLFESVKEKMKNKETDDEEEEFAKAFINRGGLRVELALDLDSQRQAQLAVNRGLREIDRRQGYRGRLGRLNLDEIKTLHENQPASVPTGMVWSLTKDTDSDASSRGTEQWTARWVMARDGERVAVPVTAIYGAGKQAVAKLDLGTRKATLDWEGVNWARAFSPVTWTAPPASVKDVVAVGDVLEVQIEHFSSNSVKMVLSQPPLVQGALVAIEPQSRQVVALVGGSDFHRSPLIRAVQSRRQPGSAFKPLVYAAAIHSRSFTPASILMDSPEVYYQIKTWKPMNFEREFLGPVSLRRALAHSINTVAVKITNDIGPDAIIALAKDLGIQSPLENTLSLALGAYEVTPMELANSFATFAAGGVAAEPVFITSIKTPQGQELPFSLAEPRQVMTAGEAYVMTSLLKEVIEEGTGKRALSLKRPLAGKTGTTSEHRDGWFVGYSPELVTSVWVGFDDHARLGASWSQGAGTALPIWIEFMEAALKDRPIDDFTAPSDVVFATIDPDNGLLAQPGLEDAKQEVFVEGTEPREYSSREVGSVQKPATGETASEIPKGLFQ
jgi:penicillin-binding protein 1A